MTAIPFAPRTSIPEVEEGTILAPRSTAEGHIPVVTTLRRRAKPDGAVMAPHLGLMGHHHIHVCTACRDREADDLPGEALITALRAGLAACGLSDAFAVLDVNCMAGCARFCTVGFQADGKAAWLFGDLTAADAPDLISFAQLYASLPDGWCRSNERPGKLSKTALARIPAILFRGAAE
jgi:predicted metal-binding protein